MAHSIPDRPEVQRTEIGPIINHVANTVFDSAEIPQGDLVVIDKAEELSDFEKFKCVVIRSVSEVVTTAGPLSRTMRPVKDIFQSRTRLGVSTFYREPFDVLSEGVKSGIIVPAQAVLAKLAEAQGIGYERDTELEIDFEEVSLLLANRFFQISLLMLARANNGTYQNSSVDETRLGSVNLPGAVLARPLFDGLNLTKEARQYLQGTINRAIGKTDGCPVRRATYPVLGDYAMKYAMSVGIEPEELKVQKRSSIISGANYLSRVFANVDKQSMRVRLV